MAKRRAWLETQKTKCERDMALLADQQVATAMEIGTQSVRAHADLAAATVETDRFKVQILAADTAPTWVFAERMELVRSYHASKHQMVVARTLIKRCKAAAQQTTNTFDAEMTTLREYRTWLDTTGQLLDTVESVVQKGLDGVRAELRLRLATLAEDKLSLERDYRQLYAARHALVAGRELQLTTRLQTIDRKRKVVQHGLAEAVAGGEIERHAQLQAECADHSRQHASTQSELKLVVEDLRLMDADALADTLFALSTVEHPRAAAARASQALVVRQQAKSKVETLFQQLLERGMLDRLTAVDPESLVRALQLVSASQCAAIPAPMPGICLDDDNQELVQILPKPTPSKPTDSKHAVDSKMDVKRPAVSRDCKSSSAASLVELDAVAARDCKSSNAASSVVELGGADLSPGVGEEVDAMRSPARLVRSSPPSPGPTDWQHVSHVSPVD
jgi:hypothetical protein